MNVAAPSFLDQKFSLLKFQTGAMTYSLKTLSIMTLGIIDLLATLSIMTLGIIYLILTLSVMSLGIIVECHYAQCHILVLLC